MELPGPGVPRRGDAHPPAGEAQGAGAATPDGSGGI